MIDVKELKELNKTTEEEAPKIYEKYGIGVRHIQVTCMTVCITAFLVVRSCMGVAILAMTDQKRKNETNIEIYDWNKTTQGYILSAFFFGYFMMQIPGGILAKKYGGKPIILFALIANGTICLAVPILARLGWISICLARFATGLTQACLFPSTHTLLGRWLPAHERTSYSGVVYSGAQLGTILSLPISGILAETALGWKLIFYSMAAMMLAVAVMWYFLAASTPAQHRLIKPLEKEYIEWHLQDYGDSEESSKIPWFAILRSKEVWAIAAAHLGYSMYMVLFYTDLPTYLEKGLGISLKSSASLSALPYIGMWLGGILSTVLSEKLVNRGFMTIITARKMFNSIASVGMAGGLIVVSFVGADQRILIITTLTFSMVGAGLTHAGFLINHLDLSPRYAGLLLSCSNAIANVGSVVSPLIAVFILQNEPTNVSRWQTVFLCMSAVSILTNVIFIVFGSATKQVWDDPDFGRKITSDLEKYQPALDKEEPDTV